MNLKNMKGENKEKDHRRRVNGIIIKTLLLFVMLMIIFEVFDNEYLIVIDQLSLGILPPVRIVNCLCVLVVIGILTPTTLTNLFKTMWILNIPFDGRDWMRVGSLFSLFCLQYYCSCVQGQLDKFNGKIMEALIFGIVLYVVLGKVTYI